MIEVNWAESLPEYIIEGRNPETLEERIDASIRQLEQYAGDMEDEGHYTTGIVMRRAKALLEEIQRERGGQ